MQATLTFRHQQLERGDGAMFIDSQAELPNFSLRVTVSVEEYDLLMQEVDRHFDNNNPRTQPTQIILENFNP